MEAINEERLIDRKMELDPNLFYDDVETEVNKLKNMLRYFDVKISNLYFNKK